MGFTQKYDGRSAVSCQTGSCSNIHSHSLHHIGHNICGDNIVTDVNKCDKLLFDPRYAVHILHRTLLVRYDFRGETRLTQF